jgi:hypothetical protein
MATTTPNLNLTKPAASDFYDINVQNDNMDKIDAGALPKAAATAADQMLVSTGAGAWAVKTLAQIKTWLGLGSAAGKTVGAAQGNVPENAAALGTTDNAAVVTDATGKLKAHASGALKSAAFTESSAYATSAQGGKADGAIQKSLATAADQMLVSNGSGTWIAKALADVKTWLGLGSAAYTASSAYATAAQGGKADGAIQKSDATAADQMLVSSGSGTWIVKTLAQIKTWLSLGSAAY